MIAIIHEYKSIYCLTLQPLEDIQLDTRIFEWLLHLLDCKKGHWRKNEWIYPPNVLYTSNIFQASHGSVHAPVDITPLERAVKPCTGTGNLLHSHLSLITIFSLWCSVGHMLWACACLIPGSNRKALTRQCCGFLFCFRISLVIQCKLVRMSYCKQRKDAALYMCSRKHTRISKWPKPLYKVKPKSLVLCVTCDHVFLMSLNQKYFWHFILPLGLVIFLKWKTFQFIYSGPIDVAKNSLACILT